MKKIVSLLLAFVFCAGLCACSADAPDGMQLASSDKAAYLLYVPTTWTLGASNEYASAYYSSDDPSNVSVIFFSPEEEKDLDDYWSDFEAEYKETFPTMNVEETSNTLLGERAAKKCVFTATVSGGEYKFTQYMAKYGGMVYILTYTAPADKYELHLQEVEKIADNFKFR